MHCFLTSYFLLLTSIAFAQPEARVFEEWATHKGEQYMYHHTRTVTDANKNIYMVGSTVNSAGNYDILVVKYDRYGVQLWDDEISGNASNDDHGLDLVLDSGGNLIVTGALVNTTSTYDLVLRKYSSVGTILWTKQFDGSAGLIDGGTSLCIGANDDVYVGGGTYGITSLSDFLVIKYNSSGVQQWVTSYDYIGLQEVVTKLVYSSGNVFVTGASEAQSGKWEMCTIKVDASNGTQGNINRTGGSSEDIDRVTDIIIDEDENIYVVGAVKNLTTDYDMKIVKLDSNLTVVWDTEIDGLAGLEDQANAIQLDASGNVYITGYVTTTSNEKDYYTCTLNSSGTILWSQTFDGEDHGEDFGVDLVLGNGHVYVTGSSYQISNRDYYTLKYTTAGMLIWEKSFNSEANLNDRAIDITLDDDGDIIVIGQADYFNDTKRYYTVKYSEKDIILPPDDETIPSSSYFIENYCCPIKLRIDSNIEFS